MGGMTDAAGALVSATVCVTFPASHFPESLEAALTRFSPYGDISRIDLTFGAATGRLLVTYYDVRATAEVLEAYKDLAGEFPPAPHDFRSVSINAAIFASLPAQFTGFQAFGDIAGVTVLGEDVVVEFFDARAAQQIALCVPGCRPVSQQVVVDEACEASLAMWAHATKLAEAHASHLLTTMTESMERLSCMEPDVGRVSGPPGLNEEKQKAGVSLSAAIACHEVPPAGGAAKSLTAKATANTSVNKVVGSTISGGGPGKPLRDKVDSKDLQKFDIVPEHVRSGEDTRTTVMIRKIPESCSREAFIEALKDLRLDNRFTFFYMPFDKRRNIHCRCAFVNFKAPSDVITMFEGMKVVGLLCAGNAALFAVSYARLQGHEQLMTHFSLSAVMNDKDARKRPVFMEAPKFHGKHDEFLRCSGMRK